MTATRGFRSSVPSYVKAILAGVFVVILLLEGWYGYQVFDISQQKRVHKQAYAFVNNVSFGLLSVDVWRDQVVDATRKELGNFRLTPEQEQGLRDEIDAQLHKLVDQAFEDINKPKKSLGDKLKKAAIKTLVDQQEVEKEIPGFSKKLMGVLTNPASYKRVTNIADTAIAQISRKIYDSSVASTRTIMDSIYRVYNAKDKAGFEQNNSNIIKTVNREAWQATWYMTGLAGIMLVLLLIFYRKTNLHALLYILASVGALLLLFVGSTTTIIEIDATLAKLDIQFLSGSISFRTQSLFFQSQSIYDVVRLLLRSGRVDSIIVGSMILIFCIIFPIVRLFATGMALWSPRRLAKNQYIDFFAFHSNKWNMADVMVVAVLMTFIGFNGIVDSTLSTLNYSEGSITSVTSNNTALEPGYIVYIAFVIMSVAMGMIRKRKAKREQQDETLAPEHA